MDGCVSFMQRRRWTRRRSWPCSRTTWPSSAASATASRRRASARPARAPAVPSPVRRQGRGADARGYARRLAAQLARTEEASKRALVASDRGAKGGVAGRLLAAERELARAAAERADALSAGLRRPQWLPRGLSQQRRRGRPPRRPRDWGAPALLSGPPRTARAPAAQAGRPRSARRARRRARARASWPAGWRAHCATSAAWPRSWARRRRAADAWRCAARSPPRRRPAGRRAPAARRPHAPARA